MLFRLLRDAYEEATSDDPLTFEEWRQEINFLYWDIALTLELIVLEVIRAVRTANFPLYVAALNALAPWFFALNHVNYARWLPVEISSLQDLSTTHPGLYEEFMKGHFVARKTERPASAIALDQAHEQVNKRLKGDGGTFCVKRIIILKLHQNMYYF